jgi:hypothetical protein
VPAEKGNHLSGTPGDLGLGHAQIIAGGHIPQGP